MIRLLQQMHICAQLHKRVCAAEVTARQPLGLPNFSVEYFPPASSSQGTSAVLLITPKEDYVRANTESRRRGVAIGARADAGDG